MNATTNAHGPIYRTAHEAVAAGNALSYAIQDRPYTEDQLAAANGFPTIHSATPSRSTQTPPRKIAAKEIHFDHAIYANTHNREPRGYGTWIFTPTHATRDQDPTGRPLPPDEARTQRHALAIWVTGTYAQARAQAARTIATQENPTRYWSTEP